MFTPDHSCPPIKSNRTNLNDARRLLGESEKSIEKHPYVRKSGVPVKKGTSCSVCENLESSARNTVMKYIKKYIRKLHFNKTELSILIRLYLELLGGDNSNKELSVHDFKQFLISTLGILEGHALDGIVRAVKVTNRAKTISLDEFLEALSILLRGNFNERVEFAFKVMDIDSDKLFRKNNEFVNLLARSFDPKIAAINPDLDAEEPERDTVNYLHRKMTDRSPHVTIEDFRNIVYDEPLLLECFVSFLPSPEKSMSFQEVLFTDTIITDSWLPKDDRIRITRKSTESSEA